MIRKLTLVGPVFVLIWQGNLDAAGAMNRRVILRIQLALIKREANR